MWEGKGKGEKWEGRGRRGREKGRGREGRGGEGREIRASDFRGSLLHCLMGDKRPSHMEIKKV
jgi:hypothetical protein